MCGVLIRILQQRHFHIRPGRASAMSAFGAEVPSSAGIQQCYSDGQGLCPTTCNMGPVREFKMDSDSHRQCGMPDHANWMMVDSVLIRSSLRGTLKNSEPRGTAYLTCWNTKTEGSD